MISPTSRTVAVDGLRITAWERPGENPPLLFAHATSFHGRLWDRVIAALPGRRAIAVDFRGHGHSDKPDPPCDWRWFGRDLAATVDQLDLRGATGVGHSMGGHAMVEAAALRPAAFAALLLIDPTIFPREYYGQPRRHDSSFILKRRNRWKSPAAMFERFRARAPFDAWDPAVLRDYCNFGLLPQDGEYVLACPPPFEAGIYESANAPAADLYPLLDSIAQPVQVIRAGRRWSAEKFDLTVSPTAPDLAAHFRHGRDLLLEGRSHFIPMESPELVAAEIIRAGY